MRLGFIGAGDITHAVVTGLSKTDLRSWPVTLSPRNETVAAKLAAEHDNVTVGADNQSVVDNSDIVFLAIRPQIAEDVTRALRFRPDQHVVSFVAATPLEQLALWTDQPVRLTQAIPLPAVATLNGATAIFPPDETIASIFAPLGVALQLSNKTEYDLLGAASALMGTYFGILETSTRWLEKKGLAYENGRTYMAQLFAALAGTAQQSPALSFEALRLGHSTKGGLNEQVFVNFDADGGTRAITDALDGVFNRIRRSD